MRRRLAAGLVAVALVALPPVTSPPAALAGSVCTAWPSYLVPPAAIRVLRTSGPASGSVQTVDFQQYVETVMAAEWVPGWPTEVLRAGAVTVKGYAWYFVMHYRGGATSAGQCYDVSDSPATDQMYSPETRLPTADEVAAVHDTWPVSVTKNGSQLMTGYRSGSDVACGSDADSWHLFQHSARDCALRGMSMSQILHVYYDPGLTVAAPPGQPAVTFLSPPSGVQLAVGTSPAVSWIEEPTAGSSVTARQVSLLTARASNGSCRVDRWLPAGTSSTVASPWTPAGLQAGVCYRVIVKLTDGSGRSAQQTSGWLLPAAAAPLATFTSPASTGQTKITGSTLTVTWTESPSTGASVVGRTLLEEGGPAPSGTSCAGASYRTIWSGSASSPSPIGGLNRLWCYRFRVTLTDSAGRTGSGASGTVLDGA